MENISIIEGKTYLNRDKFNSLLVAIVGELTKADFRETNIALEALTQIAFESPVRIVRNATHGTRVYINTPNRKRLARAVFDEIRHYLGDPKNKPVNTADEALILERGNEWVQNQPDSDILNPQDYAAYVFGATDEVLAKMKLDEAERKPIIEAVEEWYNRQAAAPTAQPLNDEQPKIISNDANSDTTPQIDETIIDSLPALYDILTDDNVIDSISKRDFINRVADGNIAAVCKKKTKFKAFIKQIKPFFNNEWYLKICNDMGLTPDKMQKYNTDRTAEFENDLQIVLKQNGAFPHI